MARKPPGPFSPGPKKTQRDLVRPPIIRTPTVLPRGPKLYQEAKDKGYRSPIAEPPPGFVGAHTSISEWVVYWGLSKVLGFPEDPRQPPFIGYPPVWYYQSEQLGGRRQAGGAVVDFVVAGGNRYRHEDVGFRLQTERFHLYADTDTHFADQVQLWRLSENMEVIDLYDYTFLPDPTGQAVIIVLKDALAGRVEPNPITDGTTQRVTRLNWRG